MTRKRREFEDLKVTAEELRLQQRCAEKQATLNPWELPDFKQWAKDNLVIQYRGGGSGFWTDWTYGQDRLYEITTDFRLRREALFLVNHKSRQVSGASTFWAGYYFYLIHHLPERNCLVAAHLDKNTKIVFNNIVRFHQYLPEQEKKPKPLVGGKAHQSGLWYDFPHNSRFYVMTAGSKESARAGMYNYWHLSEVAFFDDPEGFRTGLLGADVSDITSDTIGVMESTANGPNDFYDMCKAGQNPNNTMWSFEFLSWLDEPKCIKVVPKNFKLEPREVEYVEDVKVHTGKVVTLEQMSWHRHKRSAFKDSFELTDQEFPPYSEKAFAYTGGPWFDLEIIRDWMLRIDQDELDKKYGVGEKVAIAPIFQGNLHWKSKHRPVVSLVDDPRGDLFLWEYYNPDHLYVLGADVSHGVDQAYSDCCVLNATTGELAAHWRNNRMKPEVFGEFLFKLGSYFGTCPVCVEWTGPGIATLQALQAKYSGVTQMTGGYPNLYYDVEERDENPTENLTAVGWSATKGRKRLIYDDMAIDVNSRKVKIYSKVMLEQMFGLAYDEGKDDWIQNHKDDYSQGYRNDSVSGFALANFMRRRATGEDQPIQCKQAAYG